MIKKFRLIVIIVFFILTTIFLLEYSQSFNNLVFSFVNPFNSLRSEISHNDFSEETFEQWKDPRGIFPIMAYNLPSNSSNLVSSLRLIEKGGINILVNGNFGWMPDPLKLKEAFKNLKNSELKWLAIIENECKDDYLFCNSNDKTNNNILKYLDLFNDDFVYGWYIWDEPGKNRKLCSPFNLVPNDDFEDINRMVKQIRSSPKYNSKLDFINLFPSYWSETKTINEYEDYLSSFYNSQEFKPRVLCFDHYPFLTEEKGGFRKDYFPNLEIIRKKSIEWNIPFWMIVLSSGHDNYTNPTIGEIRFQVFSALAYGAKGIGYYLYSKSFEQIGYRSWILDNYVDNENVDDSLHGILYVPVKNLNKQIQNLGSVLLNSRSIGFIHTSIYPDNIIQPEVIDSLKKRFFIDSIFIENKNFSADLLIGLFEDENFPNRKQILVVNKDYKNKLEFKLSFLEDIIIRKLDKNYGKLEVLSGNHNIKCVLEAGEGELFLIDTD